MRIFLQTIALSLLFVCVSSLTLSAQTATISTDQSDYAPGSTAIITGSGFQPGETVTLQVLHDPTGGDDATSPAHQPWTVVADASGNINSTWLVPGDADELGATLQLTAVGQSSGLTASVVFTDATGISNLTIGSQNGTLTYGTIGTATYHCSMKVTGNPSNITVSFTFAPSLPSGVTANTITLNANANPLNFDLILTTSVTTPATSHTYTVTATTSDGHSTTSSTNALSLVIGKATPTVTITPSNYTYNGSPQGPDATVTSNSGTGTSYTFSYSGTGSTSYGPSSTKPTNAGSYTVTATVAASADGNYTSATSSATPFTINKAPTTTTVTINGGPFTYTGLAQTPATVRGTRTR